VSDCALCARPATRAHLDEIRWAPPDLQDRIAAEHPWWRRGDGACPACVQQTLLEELLEHGEAHFRDDVQGAWPLDAAAAFGALPTPLRMRADPRLTGRGTTIAIVDSGFYPHPDLVAPRNRIRAWADASGPQVNARLLSPTDLPRWPGWDDGRAGQWHGLMTSAVAAGNGWLSHGLYRGLAPEAELVLVQVLEPSGRITNAGVARALGWLADEASSLGVSVVNLSLGGDPVDPMRGNAVDRAVEVLV
jgi:serine protease AprX